MAGGPQTEQPKQVRSQQRYVCTVLVVLAVMGLLLLAASLGAPS